MQRSQSFSFRPHLHHSEASRSGKGQVVDAAMVDGASMLAAPFFAFMAAGLLVGVAVPVIYTVWGRGRSLRTLGLSTANRRPRVRSSQAPPQGMHQREGVRPCPLAGVPLAGGALGAMPT